MMVFPIPWEVKDFVKSIELFKVLMSGIISVRDAQKS